jgi:hypothetical protein
MNISNKDEIKDTITKIYKQCSNENEVGDMYKFLSSIVFDSGEKRIVEVYEKVK